VLVVLKEMGVARAVAAVRKSWESFILENSYFVLDVMINTCGNELYIHLPIYSFSYHVE
jgi:hypothetical protein